MTCSWLSTTFTFVSITYADLLGKEAIVHALWEDTVTEVFWTVSVIVISNILCSFITDAIKLELWLWIMENEWMNYMNSSTDNTFQARNIFKNRNLHSLVRSQMKPMRSVQKKSFQLPSCIKPAQSSPASWPWLQLSGCPGFHFL